MTAALFTKDGDQGSALFDMQATWFELAASATYLRKKEYGKVRRVMHVRHGGRVECDVGRWVKECGNVCLG